MPQQRHYTPRRATRSRIIELTVRIASAATAPPCACICGQVLRACQPVLLPLKHLAHRPSSYSKHCDDEAACGQYLSGFLADSEWLPQTGRGCTWRRFCGVRSGSGVGLESKAKVNCRSLSSIHILYYNHSPTARLRPHSKLCCACGFDIFNWTERGSKSDVNALLEYVAPRV